MLVRRELVSDGERALAARGELAVEGMALIPGLDLQRLGHDGSGIGEGYSGLACNGGNCCPTGLLVRFGGLLPRRKRLGVGAPVSFASCPREGFNTGVCHLIDDARGVVMASAKAMPHPPAAGPSVRPFPA